MNRHRWVQLACLAVALMGLLATAVLSPTINRERRQLGLGFDIEVGDRVPTKYALAASLGSFRGLAVDALWYRAEQLKQEGKYYEANSLAQWITTLQPRFPQVWSFHAWNLAYNISVQTHTPEERWDWVSKGINLIRSEGIVYNPKAVRLYRELAWIFFHKVGKDADDMHWYYKRQLAQEWHELLGAPIEGGTPEQAVERFKPIADAADAYFVASRLSYETRQHLRELAKTDSVVGEKLLDLADLSLVRVDEALRELETKRAKDDPAGARRLEPLRQMIDTQLDRANEASLALLFADKPEALPVVEAIQSVGLDLDQDTLRRVGFLLMLEDYLTLPTLVERAPRLLEDHRDQQLLAVRADPQLREGFDATLAYLRAKVLIEDFNMDPGLMLELMNKFGPIDWRHPAAHGVYWAFLGVRRSGELIDDTKIDIINTDRNIIHGLQELMHRGRMSYDPFTQYLDLMPDPRFIPAYEEAVYEASGRTEDADIDMKSGTLDSFASGHENFLAKAVLYNFMYGEEAEAQHYYDRLRNEYGGKPHNLFNNSYGLPLKDYVTKELLEEVDRQIVARQLIDAFIRQGMEKGLANGRPQVFYRFADMAKAVHAKYQEDKLANPKSVQDRQRFLPFDQVLLNSYSGYMRNRTVPVLIKQRIWTNTPGEIRQATYADIRAAVMAHAQASGFDPARAFPPPPGYEEKPDETLDATRDASKTIERN